MRIIALQNKKIGVLPRIRFTLNVRRKNKINITLFLLTPPPTPVTTHYTSTRARNH